MRTITVANSFDVSTSYNYWIEVCSLVFLLCLLVRFFVAKKFLSKVNIIFGAAIVCGIFDVSLDILGCLCLENYESCPKLLSEVINSIFYLFHILFPILLYTFLIFMAGITNKARRGLSLFLIPAALFILILVTNSFTNLIFHIDYSAAARVEPIFQHGPLFIGFYLITGFYVGLTFISIHLLRFKIEKSFMLSMCFSLVFIIAALTLQCLFPQYLLTGLAISLTCWLNYEHIASASDMIDKTSGVYNYNAFLNYLKDDIHFAKSQYVIVCNVGSITEINAKMGILTGNHVYKELGNFFNRLNNKKVWAFRLHSSRFVLVFNSEIALKIALDSIETRFDQPWKVQDNLFDLSISGYYVKGDIHAKSAAEFFDYLAALDSRIKKESNSNFVAVDQTLIEEISRVKSIEAALKTAINNNFKGFEVHYQPIYKISTNSFNHSETLLRFTDPELGSIGPAEFIPIAENCGLAVRIDNFVFNSCCEFLRKNTQIDFIDINISAAEFFANPSKDFIKTVRQYGVDPRKICIEVTETATVANPEIFEEFMTDMVKEGFTFAIDDFGTGYSNISRIATKNFGIVKLDKTLLASDKKMATVLKAVIHMLHKLNIPIVMEGVETKEQFEKMRDYGVEYIQGWYFSKALPEQSFIQFVINSERCLEENKA